MKKYPYNNASRCSAMVMNILACPKCQGALVSHYAFSSYFHFYCRYCQLHYPMKDNVAFLRPEDGVESKVQPLRLED